MSVTPAPLEEPVDLGAGRCPFDHRAATTTAAPPGACPFPHTSSPAGRSRADRFVWALLRIRERPAHVSEASAYASFQRSMAISALRCTLTYVVFPFVLPAVGFATGVGPILGIVIGVVAMTCDVFTIRRFFQADHRWRWPISSIAAGVIVLLSILLVQDVAHLVG